MKKFRFPLLALQKQRKVLQDVAKKDHEEAMDRLRGQHQAKVKMLSDVDAARDKAFHDQHREVGSIDRMQLASEFIERQAIRLKNQDEKIGEAQAQVETLQEILRQKAIDHKIIERLHEKQRMKHHKDVEKIRQKQTDDLNTMRYRRVKAKSG